MFNYEDINHVVSKNQGTHSFYWNSSIPMMGCSNAEPFYDTDILFGFFW